MDCLEIVDRCLPYGFPTVEPLIGFYSNVTIWPNFLFVQYFDSRIAIPNPELYVWILISGRYLH